MHLILQLVCLTNYRSRKEENDLIFLIENRYYFSPLQMSKVINILLLIGTINYGVEHIQHPRYIGRHTPAGLLIDYWITCYYVDSNHRQKVGSIRLRTDILILSNISIRLNRTLVQFIQRILFSAIQVTKSQ